MNNLLNITTNQLTMSSLEIAELCEKKHIHVMRDIREMLTQLGLSKNGYTPFMSEYKDSQGKSQPCYHLPKDETLCLVAGYYVPLRMKIIKRWKELESNQHKLPSNYIEALEALTEQAKANQQLQIENQHKEKVIEEAKPKVLFANAVETSKNSILIGELAKLLKQNNIDIGQKRLFDWLREHEYIHKNKNIPTQKSMNLQLFEVKEIVITKPDGSILTYFTPKVTGKGQTYFINKFLHSNNKQLIGAK